MDDANRPDIPAPSIVLGYGPMVPLLIAGVAAWVMPSPWPFYAIQLSIIWAGLVLAFIGGARRGFGFGNPATSKPVEITAAAAYLFIALLAFVVPHAAIALPILAVGFVLAAFLDRRAALRGNAPLFFAKLRPPQLLLGVLGLMGCWAWLMTR